MASESLHLYYFPSSFYSQRVLLALREKKLSYKETIINIQSGEQNNAWFLRLNPNGQVPMLKVGEKYIVESERILEAIDRLSAGKGPCLIPDTSTAEGKLVAEWRTKLEALPIEVLTFGVLLNPELHTKDMEIPASFRKTKAGYLEGINKSVERLEAMKRKYPDVADAYEKKIVMNKNRSGDMFDLTKVKAVLLKVDTILGEVEAQLRKSRTEHILVHWLCGDQFTAADINLCVILGRLQLLGLLSRFADPNDRPALMEYWNQALARPTVKKTVDVIPATQRYFMKKLLARVAGGVVVAGAVVTVGVLLARRKV